MFAWIFLIAFLAGAPHALSAESVVTHIPDEYESNSAFSAAMNNGGYAANDPHSAIRANPALLGTQKAYSVAAGYHWPVEGRDYYQASVVDTKTSPVAAGVSYTSFIDKFKYNDDASPQVSRFDSPLEKRGVIAFSHAVGKGTAGVGATYISSRLIYNEWLKNKERKSVQGTGLNLGFAYPITNQVIVGGAVENMSNSNIKDYAPRTQKLGAAYIGGQITANVDLRQRERVNQFEAPLEDIFAPEVITDDEPEKMAIASLTGKMQNYLTITGSYGQSLTDDRKQLGGGVSLKSQNFVLSYTANRPYLAKSAAHQSIALILDVSM
jgi:hypothetical protein